MQGPFLDSEESGIEKEIERKLRGYRPAGRIGNERELELELRGKLSSVFGPENVETQKKLRYGKIDIVINQEYAIELKLPSSYTELIRSEGQFHGMPKISRRFSFSFTIRDRF
jgi:hypothetical protein